MDDEDAGYWLAGLLEGEGSFLAGPPSRPTSPIVALPMTDQDIVERVAVIFDRRMQTIERNLDLGHKPCFFVSIKGSAAANLMHRLRPLMGRRRQAQIDRALSCARSRAIRWRSQPSDCAVTACEARPSRKGLCKRHYNAWWKAGRSGRATDIAPRESPGPLGETALDIPPHDDSRALLWLAGLLEGEGNFGQARARGGQEYPTLKLEMTDLDVVERAAAIMGIPNVAARVREDEAWSVTFVAKASGSNAASWMRRLRPYMGERRGRAIDCALDAYHPIRLVDPPTTCVVPSCDKSHKSRGLCNKRYMKWSRDRAKGRAPRVKPLR